MGVGGRRVIRRGAIYGWSGGWREDHTGCVVFFFFQAEDGIRDLTVTGVQTCALPISRSGASLTAPPRAPPIRPAPLPRRVTGHCDGAACVPPRGSNGPSRRIARRRPPVPRLVPTSPLPGRVTRPPRLGGSPIRGTWDLGDALTRWPLRSCL